MYFVDEETIIKKLDFYDKNLSYVTELKEIISIYEQYAMERISHLMIESILDVGNALIDGFIMRDPGSYEDIIDILTDEKVLPISDATIFKELVTFRKSLVREYMNVDIPYIFNFIIQHQSNLGNFSSYVTQYLVTKKHTYHTFIAKEN